MIIRPDELLTRIRLPRRADELQHYYRKVGTRKAQAISKVCFAGTAQVRDGKIEDLRIALGSIAPVPLRCVKTEDALRGSELNQPAIARARAVLANEIVPIDDIRSTSNYRHQVSLNLLEDFLRQLSA
jgi:CO/xanthine dehydrogenase FAD-binding subunit